MNDQYATTLAHRRGVEAERQRIIELIETKCSLLRQQIPLLGVIDSHGPRVRLHELTELANELEG